MILLEAALGGSNPGVGSASDSLHLYSHLDRRPSSPLLILTVTANPEIHWHTSEGGNSKDRSKYTIPATFRLLYTSRFRLGIVTVTTIHAPSLLTQFFDFRPAIHPRRLP